MIFLKWLFKFLLCIPLNKFKNFLSQVERSASELLPGGGGGRAAGAAQPLVDARQSKPVHGRQQDAAAAVVADAARRRFLAAPLPARSHFGARPQRQQPATAATATPVPAGAADQRKPLHSHWQVSRSTIFAYFIFHHGALSQTCIFFVDVIG
jgi:hypothetical protein